MCLGVPGRVVRWINTDPLFAKAEVEFAGICRDVHMACARGAEVGNYVVVHAGIAVCILDESEARQTLEDLERAEALDVALDIALDGESDEIP